MLQIIGGKYKRLKLKTPKGLNTRPTSSRLREALFNILQHEMEGARFLDLFAGSGACGFEALSRGAKEAVFVDMDRAAQRCLKKNAKALGVENQVTIFSKDALSFIKGSRQLHRFDLIYIDPPYGITEETGSGEKVVSVELLKLIDQKKLLAPGGHLFIEEMLQEELKNLPLENHKLVDLRKLGRSWLYHYLCHS